MGEAKTKLIDLRRLYKTVPELDTAEKRSGATFVNILFGLVVSEGVRQMVLALREAYLVEPADLFGAIDALHAARVSHLGLALVVTTLSWIGYHQSQKYPPFLIKFVNIPLFTFALDVLMVASYYGLIATAESAGGSDEPMIGASVRPETGLVVFVFVLYVAWDEAGFRLFRDPEYSFRMQTLRRPEVERGPRRRVTLGAFVGSILIGVLVLTVDPDAPRAVIAIDALLVALVVAYRLAKQAVQDTVLIRGADPKAPRALGQWYTDHPKGS